MSHAIPASDPWHELIHSLALRGHDPPAGYLPPPRDCRLLKASPRCFSLAFRAPQSRDRTAANLSRPGLSGGPPFWRQVPPDSLASSHTAASLCPDLQGDRAPLVPGHLGLGTQTLPQTPGFGSQRRAGRPGGGAVSSPMSQPGYSLPGFTGQCGWGTPGPLEAPQQSPRGPEWSLPRSPLSSALSVAVHPGCPGVISKRLATTPSKPCPLTSLYGAGPGNLAWWTLGHVASAAESISLKMDSPGKHRAPA